MKRTFLIALAIIMGFGAAYAQQSNTIETSVNVKKEYNLKKENKKVFLL